MFVVEPPNKVPKGHFTIFLAGSIEMGKATDWQAEIIRRLNGYDCVVLNPRRKDWDSSWVQSSENVNFTTQVAWEMNGLEECELAVFYFEPGTLSPISLMELGWMSGMGKRCIVCCPEGFWRKGNVDLLCARNNIRQVDTLDSLIKEAVGNVILRPVYR